MSIQQIRPPQGQKRRVSSLIVRPLQALCLSALLGSSPSQADGKTTDIKAHSTTPSALNYNVWIDDRPMGQHTYRFEHAGEHLKVISEANFKVKVLLVTVFNYQHQAIETWRGNCLQAIASSTTSNGEEESLDLRFSPEECPGTYTYWDSTRLKRAQLTNAQNGQVENASWKALSTDSLPNIGTRKTIRYDQPIRGVALQTPSAQFSLYYDTADTLLMMQTDNDGRTITYLHDSLRVR